MTTRLRVGLLTSVGATVDAFFPRIVQRWAEHGVEVFAASSSPQVGLDVPYTPVPALSRSPGPRNLHAGRQLRRWSTENRLTHVLTNTATASAVARMSRLPVPVVYFCHGLHWDHPARMSHAVWRSVERALLTRTSAVVTINRDDDRWFRARFPSDRIRYLPGGVGLNPALYPRAPMPESSILLLCWIGELSRRKSPLDVVLLAEGLRARGLAATIDVLGEGPLVEDVRRVVRERDLQRWVLLRGHADAATALRDSHALVHTARWEGLPRVALEAAAVGRPVYAYDAKGVRDAPTVRTVPERDPSLLAGLLAADWRSGRLESVDQLPAVEALDSHRAADQIVELLAAI